MVGFVSFSSLLSIQVYIYFTLQNCSGAAVIEKKGEKPKLQQQVLFLCSEHQVCLFTLHLRGTESPANSGSPELGPMALAMATVSA